MRLVLAERYLSMLHPLLTLSTFGHSQFADALADQNPLGGSAGLLLADIILRILSSGPCMTAR